MLKRVAGASFGFATTLAFAQSPATFPVKEEAIITLEKFSVQDQITDPVLAIGTDRTRNAITITREALLAAPAGISGLKMLETLPGFNVQTSDSLGLYEFGNSVTVRAFSYRQIGFVHDGVPMGRSDQFGGSPIYRYVDNENLGRVTASQGTGEVSQPSYASLGPIAPYTTIAPSTTPGLLLAATTGSYELERTFLKVQSGKWNGLSAYLSRSNQISNQWRGPGTFDREHWEAKLRFELNPAASIQFGFVSNDYFDYDSPTISKAQYAGAANDLFGRKGRYYGYLASVPDLPVTAPGITYSNTAHNQYYLHSINSRNDSRYTANAVFEASSALRLAATGYYEDKEGYGVSPEAYATSRASYNAQRLIVPGLNAPRGLQYGLSTVDGKRYGALANVTYKLAAQELLAGVWIETDDYHRTQNRFNQAGGNPAGQPLLNEFVHRQRDFKSKRESVQLYAKDVISLLDNRLKIELGIKSLDVDYEIVGYRNPADYINQRRPKLTDNFSDSFLPQAGVVYSVNATDQIFASYAENFALPRGADDIYATASPAAPGPKAETAKNYEAGYRLNRGTVNLVAAVYYTSFANRLQSFASLVPGSTQFETFFQNVGSVESSGVELSGGYRPAMFAQKLSLNGSATYNKGEFKDSYGTVAIAGKTVPDSPEYIFQGSATYEPVAWAAVSFSARALTCRFSNFVNTESVGGYSIYSAYVDLGGGKLSLGPVKNVKVRFNVEYLFDKDYLGTISTTATTTAVFRPGPDRTFQLTVSASF